MALPLPVHRFTVAEYHRMAETGILHPSQRVELIQGEIVDMAPIGRRHLAVVDRLNRSLVLALADQAIVRVQGALRLDDFSEPQPDLVVLRPRADFYAERDAGPADVLLVIEVADTSEPYDGRVKVPLYARAGLQEVWLVDLNAATVTAYRAPTPEGYSQSVVAARGDALSPLAFPVLTLPVAAILG